jgi:hypothetical protein
MKRTSLKSGTRRIVQVSDVKSVAARIGNTAFFAPLATTSPRSGTPPLIDKASMNQLTDVFEIFFRSQITT